jgi:HEAT repeat protein
MSLCKTADGSIVGNALGALGAIGPEAREAVPVIVEVLFRTDPTRIEAARALGGIGVASKDVVAKLARALELSPPRKIVPGVSDAGPFLRNDFCRAALESLGKFGPAAKEALPVVRRFCDDPVWPVRDDARAALKQIAPGE